LLGRTPLLEIATVTDIRDGRVYLDGSKVALRFPDRIMIKND
jgi:type IV secretory pathway VirB9-like protein